MKKSPSSRFSRVLALTALIGAFSLLAQERGLAAITAETWSSTSSTTWESAGNWTPSSAFPNSNAYSAVFNGTTANNTPNLTANETINALSFAAGSQTYTIGSTGAFTLAFDDIGATDTIISDS